MNMKSIYKYVVLAVAFAAFRPGTVLALTIRERLVAPVQTLNNAPTLALGTSITIAYARTFQKSGTSNRVLGLLPIVDWGILSMDFLGATPDVSSLWDQPGLVGVGGGVHLDRVLAAMFPELAAAFKGPVPFSNGKLDYSFEPGVGAGYDFTAKEAVEALYIGGGVHW